MCEPFQKTRTKHKVEATTSNFDLLFKKSDINMAESWFPLRGGAIYGTYGDEEQ